jgi:hypothetical protein
VGAIIALAIIIYVLKCYDPSPRISDPYDDLRA